MFRFNLIINFADKRQKGKLMFNNNNKRLVASVLALSLSFYVLSPALAADTNITTSVKINSVSSPIVKAKWEMNIDDAGPVDDDDNGTDDSSAAGAQFDPSGIYGVDKNIAICAVVTDPNGLADISSVETQIHYPEDVALDSIHRNPGCGGTQSIITLSKLSKELAQNLFCNKIRQNNHNLPTFNTDYDYDEICGGANGGGGGELAGDSAAIYCGTDTLSYGYFSGEYKAIVTATDSVNKTGKLENTFKYDPLTAFQTDFNKIDYGEISLNDEHEIAGDYNWNLLNEGSATIRDVGNTRLDIKALQNDMGLGKTNGDWNVHFDSRVGNIGSDTHYDPEVNTAIAKTLNIAEMSSMDFSILVSNTPNGSGNIFTGTMVLSAAYHSDYTCNL
jgi:hypothetical protein